MFVPTHQSTSTPRRSLLNVLFQPDTRKICFIYMRIHVATLMQNTHWCNVHVSFTELAVALQMI